MATSGGGLVATALVLALAAGGAGAAGGTAGDGGTSGVEGTSARARDRSTTRVVQRLEARGLQVTRLGDDATDNCAAHAYGEVRAFLREHPCTALYRALFEVRDEKDVVVVAVAWVDLPDTARAREFQRLVDRHGTGNLTELTEEGDGPGSVQWTGQRYASVRDGVTVVNAQAEPVDGTARAARFADSTADATVG